uniref:Uncharacterized protein n=1 Tax=Amphimedon queenslandica TaxID=400682 RepID=A0A1X7VCV3_AMPQE
MKYTLNRIPSLNEFCVICDERHVLETGLLRPCVCTRELCVFAFQTLGVMADAAESVATDASVVDLLIAMCNAATNSMRQALVMCGEKIERAIHLLTTGELIDEEEEEEEGTGGRGGQGKGILLGDRIHKELELPCHSITVLRYGI